jgi:hypothetical protein
MLKTLSTNPNKRSVSDSLKSPYTECSINANFKNIPATLQIKQNFNKSTEANCNA